VKRKHKRLTFAGIAMLLLATAAALILSAFEDSIVFFYSPTELAKQKPGPGLRLRIGGLVEEGSVAKPGGAIVSFRVTDMRNVVAVRYKGILPDLIREGQGVVAEGRLQNGVFQADEVLAKHDENYMPSEVADALRESGQWKGKDMETEQ